MKKEEKISQILNKVDDAFDKEFPIRLYSSDIEITFICGCGKKEETQKIKGKDQTDRLKSFYHTKIKEIMEEMGKEIIGKKEKMMTKKEADEIYEMNSGNVDYQTILNIGNQDIINKNQVRQEQREKLIKFLNKV